MVSPLLVRLRIPLVLLSLGVILFYTFSLVTLVPNFGFRMRWTPEGIQRVTQPLPEFPLPDGIRSGDRLLEINGASAIRSLWRFQMTPGTRAYTYLLERDGEQVRATVPTQPYYSQLVRRRMTPGLIGLGAWAIAALILLLASPRNRAAWRTGLVTCGLAVALTASEAALYGVPLAQLLSDPWLALLCIAFAQLAFVPGEQKMPAWAARLFALLYGLAGVLGLLLLLDMLWLIPARRSIYALTGLVVYDWVLLACGAGLLLNPLLLLARYVQLPSSQARRQVRFLLILTALAVTPLSLLTILPRFLVDEPFLPWDVGFGLLLFIPLAYGYVIYRRSYLNLDLIATQALTFLLLALLGSLLFVVALTLLRVNLPLSQEVSTLLAVVLALLGVLGSNRYFQRGARRLVFGHPFPTLATGGSYAARLARHPEQSTLAHVCAEAAGVVQAGKVLLLLTDGEGKWRTIYSRNVPDEKEREDDKRRNADQGDLQYGDLPHPSPSVQVRNNNGSAETPPFSRVPWAALAAPLVSDGKGVGLLLLGPKVPDDDYNALDVAFVEQVAGVMAMAAGNIQLFESSRAMSRELLRVRDWERMQLSTRLHDESLQQVTLVASALDRMAVRHAGDEAGEEAQEQRGKLLLVNRHLRAICADLHPPSLDQGLDVALASVLYALQVEENLHLVKEIEIPAGWRASRPTVTAVYHILTKALTNVMRHAQASRVGVTLIVSNAGLCLSVEDDGVGVDVESLTLSDLLRRQHFGLVGMHEWAQSVDGELRVERRAEGGTRVELTIPLAERSLRSVSRTPVL